MTKSKCGDKLVLPRMGCRFKCDEYDPTKIICGDNWTAHRCCYQHMLKEVLSL